MTSGQIQGRLDNLILLFVEFNDILVFWTPKSFIDALDGVLSKVCLTVEEDYQTKRLDWEGLDYELHVLNG